MSASENPVLINNRRRRLESLLLEATKHLPHHAGLPKQRLSYFESLFGRKAPAPKTEEEIIANDTARRQAVLEIVTARVAAGHEPVEAQRKWESIIRMGQAGKQVLWQQHAYIAATLEDRNDKEELAKGEAWMEEGKSLRRLLRVTQAAPNNGGIQKPDNQFIEHAFSSQTSGLSSEAISQRRDAKILLLRARLSAGLYEKVDEELKWEGRDLPDPDEMTTKEMPNDGAGEAFGGVEEDDNGEMGCASEPAYGREAAPSPDRMADPRPPSPPARARREYTPVPLNP